MRIRSLLCGVVITLLLLALIVLSTPASSQETAATTESVVIDFSIMDEKCRSDPDLEGRCFVPPLGHTYSGTIGEFVYSRAKSSGARPEIIFEMLVAYNGWHGATYETVIPAGTAFRTA